MPRCRARESIAGQRIERVADAAQRIEPWMRHRHRRYDDRMPAKRFNLEAEALKQLAVRLERIGLRHAEMERSRKEKPLRRCGAALEHVHELLEENALMRGVLIDEDDPFPALEHEIGAPQLYERRHIDRRNV